MMVQGHWPDSCSGCGNSFKLSSDKLVEFTAIHLGARWLSIKFNKLGGRQVNCSFLSPFPLKWSIYEAGEFNNE